MYVSTQQQLEGLAVVLKRVPPKLFLRALDNLVANRAMSRSMRWKYVRRMRKLLGLSWAEYLKLEEL